MPPIARGIASVLGTAYAATGAWALLAPASWVRSYPGFGRHWLSATDGASPHLVGDTGAGFLAVGAALLTAAVLAQPAAARVAAVALLAHTLPHFVFHLTHPDPNLPTLDVVLGVWGLAVQAALAAAALLWVRHSPVPAPETA